MIRGMIFDIDGTLLDSMPIWYDLGARYLRSLGIMPESDLGGILNSMTLEEGIMYLRSHYNLEESPSRIRRDLKGIMDAFYRHEVQTKPGARAFLQACQEQNIPMILVTIGDAELAEAALRRNGIWQYFAGVLTCEALHTNKHAPRIYQKAAELLGTDPSRTLVFEDLFYAVKAAKDAGFTVAAILDDAGRKDWPMMARLADIAIRDFTDAHFLQSLDQLSAAEDMETSIECATE
ncbi:MAG: HAD family phosphatase [Lachnospiraceae bacterium]|nr:HAD family phosphatase [Lachnospiraceae bacterium]